MLSSAFGAVFGSTGTICGYPFTTFTGTLTVSSRLLSPEPYVTVTGAVNVSSPTFPFVSGILVSSTVFSFPSVVTAPLSLSAVGLSPSTT